MSAFYKVEKIVGKGFGCIATKDIKRGTLILKEKGQVFDNGSKSVTEDWIKNVVNSFNGISKSDQEEFFKLHNRFLDQDLTSDQAFTKIQNQCR